jgi:hypothetical protein
MAVEKVLMTVPMESNARRDLAQARRVLADRLYLLEVERETNPTVAAFVEAKRSNPPILVGTRIVSIQVSKASDQFGWEKGFVVLSSDSQAALKWVAASLDPWNGHPMRMPASEITLTSVLAFEDPAGTARKIPNRRLFPAQFTMASDASETTVAS